MTDDLLDLFAPTTSFRHAAIPRSYPLLYFSRNLLYELIMGELEDDIIEPNLEISYLDYLFLICISLTQVTPIEGKWLAVNRNARYDKYGIIGIYVMSEEYIIIGIYVSSEEYNIIGIYVMFEEYHVC